MMSRTFHTIFSPMHNVHYSDIEVHRLYVRKPYIQASSFTGGCVRRLTVHYFPPSFMRYCGRNISLNSAYV